MMFMKGQSICRKNIPFRRNDRKEAVKAKRKEKNAAEVKSIVVVAILLLGNGGKGGATFRHVTLEKGMARDIYN